jgi:CRP-like cAMP-binding protein
MSNIDQFTTDNFRILEYMYDIQGQDGKVSVTQQEIANMFSLSRATVNKIIGELKSGGYIKADGNHVGRYVITQNALNFVKTIKSITLGRDTNL